MCGLRLHQFGKARAHRCARSLHRQGRGLRDFGCERNGRGAKLLLRDEQVGREWVFSPFAINTGDCRGKACEPDDPTPGCIGISAASRTTAQF